MKTMYSPKEFGELIGKSVITLQKWDRKGILKAHRSPTNRRYYTHDQYLTYRGLVAPEQGLIIAYARVSGVAQRPDLANQLKALEVYCKQHTIKVDEWMQDIGSGLNYKRKQFNRLMEMVELGQVRRIVIAHRDLLVRFGYGYFEAFCQRHNTDLVIIDVKRSRQNKSLFRTSWRFLPYFQPGSMGCAPTKRSLRMLLCKKIKLRVTEQDAATLEFMQGKCRGLYNWWVMKLRDGEKWPGWRIAKKTLQASKQHDPELCQVYGKLLHEVYFRLGAAMDAFFRRVAAGEKPGFPRVRPRHCFFTLIYPAMYLTIEGKTLILPTGGKGAKNKHYPNIEAELTEVPPEGFREVAISRDGRGDSYASFSYRLQEEEQQAGQVVAFDLGIKTLATGVNEQDRFYSIGGFKGGQWYNKQLDKLRSKRDKCKKKSRRYIHLSQVYKRVSQKKRDKQRDSLHKASHLIAHKLVERTVVIGDLSQRQMVMKEHAERNKDRNRAVFNDWGLYTFTEMLIYKCHLYGKELVFLDERNTSKECSRCGNLQAMPLWKRTYCCTNCGLVMDRDKNSAVNILTRFLARRGPYTSSETCGVLHKDQNSVEVVEASCPTQVQQLKLW